MTRSVSWLDVVQGIDIKKTFFAFFLFTARFFYVFLFFILPTFLKIIENTT